MTTRYPKSGKGTRWTNIELKSISADWKGDTLSDSAGLFGEVRVALNGQVSIRFKYSFRWQGKASWFACGTYPKESIAAIRKQSDQAQAWLGEGLDPRLQKQVEKIYRLNIKYLILN